MSQGRSSEAYWLTYSLISLPINPGQVLSNIDTKAKMSSKQKFICKGTLGQVIFKDY